MQSAAVVFPLPSPSTFQNAEMPPFTKSYHRAQNHAGIDPHSINA